MGESSQNKSQLHTRQTMERNYSLRLFGIKIDDMPIIFTGKPNLKMHTKFIKFQQAKEKLYWRVQYVSEICTVNGISLIRGILGEDDTANRTTAQH